MKYNARKRIDNQKKRALLKAAFDRLNLTRSNFARIVNGMNAGELGMLRMMLEDAK